MALQPTIAFDRHFVDFVFAAAFGANDAVDFDITKTRDGAKIPKPPRQGNFTKHNENLFSFVFSLGQKKVEIRMWLGLMAFSKGADEEREFRNENALSFDAFGKDIPLHKKQGLIGIERKDEGLIRRVNKDIAFIKIF